MSLTCWMRALDLNKKFPGISRCTQHLFIVNFQTTCVCFILFLSVGYCAVKGKVFKPPNAPKTLIQMEQRIEQLIGGIGDGELGRVFDSFVERCRLCVRFGGGLTGHTVQI